VTPATNSERIVLRAIFACTVICCVTSWLSAAGAAESDPKIQAEPYPSITNLFQNKRGWVGADSAYSIPLGNGTTLWTFGDTWIGAIENGRRVGCKMINNSAAVQKLGKNSGSITFSWADKKDPASLWAPSQNDGSYYWPADGAVVDGKLYMFLHKIKPNNSKPDLFKFDTVCDALMTVENPRAEPANWRHTIKDLGNNAEELFVGTACVADGDYLYVLCSYPKIRSGTDAHPQVLARVQKKELDEFNFSKLEYFCHEKSSGANEKGAESNDSSKIWRKELKEPVVLFPDGAPELTVTRVPGIDGFVAVYMPPLSRDIMIRRATKPEGPWGERQKIYTCPEANDIMVYSAKAHEELATQPGELVLTYCRNSDDKSHVEKPEIYFPQGLRFKIQASPSP
jgi:hypothetical protein